jgi:hypothetical protein
VAEDDEIVQVGRGWQVAWCYRINVWVILQGKPVVRWVRVLKYRHMVTLNCCKPL